MVNADLSNVNGWKKLPLKDIVDIKTGKKDANEGDENGIYRFYTCAKDYSFIKDYEFNEEAILISGNGAYVGYVHYFNGKFDAYQRTYILSNFSVDVFFLYHYLGEKLSFQIHREKQDGATPYITKGTLAKFKIEYPENTKEQTAIATILSKVDEAIEATRQSIKAAEKLKKALMQNLLTGKLKPDGTWRTDDEFYEDEKFGKVPVGWEVKAVNELIERKNDTIDPVKSKQIFDYVGLEHIAPNEFSRIGKGKSNETLAIKVLFKKGDLLYGKLRPYLNKVWLADITGVGSTEFLVFQKNNYVDWIYLNFQTKRFLNFTLSMTAGTQHPRASWRDVKRFLVIKPIENNELELISNKIISTEIDKKQKQTKIQTLQRLKKSLMQNLLTGKVRLDIEAINKIISEQ